MTKKIKYFDEGGSSDGDGGGSSYAFSGGFGDGSPSESDAASYNALQAEAAAENAAKAAGTYQGLGWSAPSNESPYGNLGWNANQTVYTTPEGEQLTGELAQWAAIDAWHRQNDGGGGGGQDTAAAAEAQRVAEEQAAAEAQRVAEEQAAAAEAQRRNDFVAQNYQDQLSNYVPQYEAPADSPYGVPSPTDMLTPQIAGQEQDGTINNLTPVKEESGFLDSVKNYLADKLRPENLPLTLLSFSPLGPFITAAKLFSGLMGDPNKTVQDQATKMAGNAAGQIGTQALGLSGLPGLLANSAISGLTQSQLRDAASAYNQQQLGAGLKGPTFTTSDTPDYGLTSLYEPSMPAGTVVGDLSHPSLNMGDVGKTVDYGTSPSFGLDTNYDPYGLKYTPKNAPIVNETYGINALGMPLASLGQELAPDYSLSNQGDLLSSLASKYASLLPRTASSTYTPLADYTTGATPAKARYGDDMIKALLEPQVLKASKTASIKSPLEHMASGGSTALDTLINNPMSGSGSSSSTKPAALAAQILSPAGSAKIQPLGLGGFQFTPIQRFADGGHPLTHDSVETGIHMPQFMSEGGMNHYVQGGGTGTSDSVPAMLATGEFVLPADVVSGLGDGSNEAGAKILDEFMQAIRKHKRSTAPSELPPDSKGPLAYLAEAAGAKVKRGKK
jgi:hypothetical protein